MLLWESEDDAKFIANVVAGLVLKAQSEGKDIAEPVVRLLKAMDQSMTWAIRDSLRGAMERHGLGQWWEDDNSA